MTDTTTLQEQRRNLERDLGMGKFKSLVEIVLDRPGRFIQRMTHSARQPSDGYSAVLISLVIFLLSAAVSILLDEFNTLRRELVFNELLTLGMVVVLFVLLKAYMSGVRSTLRESILDAIESDANVVDLRDWLTMAYHPKATLVFSLAAGLVLAPALLVGLYLSKGQFIGVGPSITFSFVCILSGMIIYYLLMSLTLPARLRQYRLRLFAIEPSSSEVIQHLAGMLMSGVYLFALATAGVTVFVTTIGLAPLIGIGVILGGWAPTVALFILNQTAISRIITRTKWQTLNEIQSKIEQLRTQEEIPSERTLTQLNKLIDYHERIKDTRNSTLDLGAGLNLLNSLLLPLLAFVLANLDKILALFQ